MTDNRSPQDSNWPLPMFYFAVQFGSQNNTVSFQEISGLDTETQNIEYRHGDRKQFSIVKMPGIAKAGNVTFKKGMFKSDSPFFEWFDNIRMNTIKRETVTIQLLDENGSPAMTWTLANAWPVKISGTDLKSDAKEVAVEILELAHEGITVTND